MRVAVLVPEFLRHIAVPHDHRCRTAEKTNVRGALFALVAIDEATQAAANGQMLVRPRASTAGRQHVIEYRK